MNMVFFFKNLKICIFSLLIIPHILVYRYTAKGKQFAEDILYMFGSKSVVTFIIKMYEKKYIRNLFYYRLGFTFKEMFSFLCPEDSSLHIMGCGSIGKKCFLQHSQNSFFNAESIGENFYCLHNVTIGNDKIKGRPIIGNNVSIFTGAVVVGKIKVGDNVIIAANSVVRSDVPDNVLVAGSPAKIVKILK